MQGFKLSSGEEPETAALTQLRWRWFIYLIGGLGMLVGGTSFLLVNWQSAYAWRWATLAGLALGYLLWMLWGALKENVLREAEFFQPETLLPYFGAANWISLARGLLIVAVLGFLGSPRPEGWLAWLPGLVYTLAVLFDFVDGYLARRLNQTTRLGEILDMTLDGLGVLAATLLVVKYGQVPAWYLLVGLARYLFLAGLWLRRKLKLPVYEMLPNMARRAQAGLQMGFIFVMLWPIFSPPGTHIAAVFFSLPFFAGFLWDWLTVSGVVNATTGQRLEPLRRLMVSWLPLALRLGVVLLLVAPALAWVTSYQSQARPFIDQGAAELLVAGLATAECLVLLLIATGTAGRIAGILGLCLLGVRQIYFPLNSEQILLAFLFAGMIYFGSGLFSAWKPEDLFIYRRLGERKPIISRQNEGLNQNRQPIRLAWLGRLWWLALPLLLAWVWREISLERMLNVLQNIRVAGLAFWIVLNLGLLLLFALRGRVILAHLGYPRPLLALVGYRLAGFGISYFTPGPQFGGEPFQVYLLHRRQGVVGPVALAAMTLDKLLELLASFTFLAVGLVITLANGTLQAQKWYLLAAPLLLLILPVAYLALLWGGRYPAFSILGWWLQRVNWPWLSRLRQGVNVAERLAAGFFRQQPGLVAWLFIFSLALWSLSMLEYWVMMDFLGLRLSPYQVLAALTAARLAFLLPLPGGVGVLEASQVIAMRLLGLDLVFGASAGLLIRLRDVLLAGSGLILGAVLMGPFQRSMRSLIIGETGMPQEMENFVDGG